MSLEYTVIEIFCNEEAQYQRTPLHEAVIDYIRSLKIAAHCMVIKGTEGCYENGEVATPTIMELSYKMPLKIEILLPSAKRAAVLPTLREMVTEGAVTFRELNLYSFRTRSSLLPRQIKVRDVMTPSPKTVTPATPIKDIIQLLSYSHFYGIPVVDEANHPVGIVTEIDLMRRGQLPMRVGLLSNVNWEHIDPALDSIAHITAADVMSHPIISIGLDDAVAKAVEQMVAKGLKRLPVVDISGKLVGILSRWDIFRTITEVTPNWKTME